MIDSYSDIVLRAGDATAKDIVLRAPPAPRNPQNIYPEVGDVRTGVVYGPALPVFQEYQTGTLSPSGGSGGFVGAPVHPFAPSRIFV